MKILIVGGGGREHALAWKVSRSPLVRKVFCAPGNPGTALVATNVDIAATDVLNLVEWAVAEDIDLTIVGPEAPLGRGLADVFRARGLRIFGPVQAASRLETSKAFAKQVLLDAGVDTPEGRVFSDYAEAVSFVEQSDDIPVIKADGLAAGKGVVLPTSKTEAIATLDAFMNMRSLGESGRTVVLEKRILGREASLMAIVSGTTVEPLAVSQDYKRIFDGDQGPNTGGMGAISPTPVLSDEAGRELAPKIMVPVLKELQKKGISYLGFLYAGLIIDESGRIMVLEFNCRLGDPETEVLLPRMEGDLVPVLLAACAGELSSQKLVWRRQAAACVVASSRGYPSAPEVGDTISIEPQANDEARVFHAGTKFAPDGEQIITAGGRVLVVSGCGDDVNEAVGKVYGALNKISFSGMHYRRDIGK